MEFWMDFRTNGTRRSLNISALLGAGYGSGAMRFSGWKSARRWSGFEMLSSLVSLLLLSGKRRTQNLQNADIRHCQPQWRQNTTDEVSLRLFWSIYEHSTQCFDLTMNLRIFPYKSFQFWHRDCLGALWDYEGKMANCLFMRSRARVA